MKKFQIKPLVVILLFTAIVFANCQHRGQSGHVHDGATSHVHDGCDDPDHDHSGRDKPAGQESFVISDDGSILVTHQTHAHDTDCDHDDHDHDHEHGPDCDHDH